MKGSCCRYARIASDFELYGGELECLLHRHFRSVPLFTGDAF